MRRWLAIAAFCGVATASLAADSRPVKLVSYFLIPGADDVEGIQWVASRYDAVILHGWSNAKVPILRAANPNIICLLYKDGMGLHLRNDVEAVDKYDYHQSENWYQVSSTGDVIKWDYNNDGVRDYAACRPDDFDWQTFWIQKSLDEAFEAGWDGVFIDDLWTYRGVYHTPMPREYPTDEALQKAVVSFLRRAATEYSRHGALLVGNIGWWTVNGSPVWRDYIANLTAGMQEKFSPKDTMAWYYQLQEIQEAIDNNYHVIGYHYGQHSDTRKALYGLCNALLVTDGQHMWYGYSNTSDPSRRPPYYDFYDKMTELGSPQGKYVINYGARYAYRNFKGGMVFVNPTPQSKTITLPEDQTFRDLDGQSVTSVSLGSFSGTFVIRQAQTSSPDKLKGGIGAPPPGYRLHVASTRIAR